MGCSDCNIKGWLGLPKWWMVRNAATMESSEGPCKNVERIKLYSNLFFAVCWSCAQAELQGQWNVKITEKKSCWDCSQQKKVAINIPLSCISHVYQSNSHFVYRRGVKFRRLFSDTTSDTGFLLIPMYNIHRVSTLATVPYHTLPYYTLP